jgi:hypothetical protein
MPKLSAWVRRFDYIKGENKSTLVLVSCNIDTVEGYILLGFGMALGKRPYYSYAYPLTRNPIQMLTNSLTGFLYR